MFADHQPRISAFARRSPENFRRVACFVLCTIRMPLHHAALDTPYAIRGEACGSIFGHKHNALAYLNRNVEDIFGELEYLWSECASDDAMLRCVMQIPGIGLAKGGFILQMVYGISGCIDTHNITRFGLHERHFQTGSKATDFRRIPDYNAFVRKVGGTARLWDDWCAYVSDRDANYPSAEYVSRLHLTPLEC
jgi:hypothetical protein